MQSGHYSTEDAFVLARLPKAGLGNKLCVWARALVFARLNGLPLVVTHWLTPHFRQFVKFGDLRLYWNYFTPWHEMSAAQQRRIQREGTIIREPEVKKLEAGPMPGTVYLFVEMPFWKRVFHDLQEHRELVRSELDAHLTPTRVSEVAKLQPATICVQIRMGDFRELRKGERFELAGGVRTPLDYFRSLVNEVREANGSDLDVCVVSDGTDAELAPLLNMKNVRRSVGHSALGDLLLMARSRVLIGSAGSTYSQWAGFLGDPVLLHHPDQMHYFCRRAEDRLRVFEGAVRPGESTNWPLLLKSNVAHLGDAQWPPVVDEVSATSPSPIVKPALKILHVPFAWWPAVCGGTEVYVRALCRELALVGVENVVAAPALAGLSECVVQDGIEVHRFAVSGSLTLDMVNSKGDAVAAAGFGALLDKIKPSIVHFHAQSPAVSVPTLKEARRRGISTVFTYHTATASCHRGSLMRWGVEPCDGELKVMRCAACQMHSLGVPKQVAWLAALTSCLTHRLARWFPSSARWQIPLRAAKLARERQAAVRAWFAGMDRIVALNAWTERLLKINDVPASRIRKVRHGLTQVIDAGTMMESRAVRSALPVRLIYLGRLDSSKGVHLLLDALAQSPSLEVTIDFYTLIEAVPGPYTRQMQERLQQDSRIRVCAPVQSAEIIATLHNYDALLVPSQWMETGPLVVLEAFAAGVPVIGSGFGGIAEWVTHERDGLLVAQGDARGWASAMQRLIDEPDLLLKLRSNLRPPRSMREVAADMLSVYAELAALDAN